ncbi:MAG: HDIG domain-containing protein [Chloroflexi bacterium]|nr:HDIG domain-containing protein [Chloroflexota bacterium]
MVNTPTTARTITRDEAWQLLTEHTKSPALLRHALAVEAAMRAQARRAGEDEAYWGIVGLLHDFDFEQHPTAEEHPFAGAKILRERGYPEALVQDILSHATYSGVPRNTPVRKALYAVDELSGFITAVALVRPTKSLSDVEPSSVRKKMKDKAFARAVNREDIGNGAAELGVDLDEHIRFVTESLKPAAAELGLKA